MMPMQNNCNETYWREHVASYMKGSLTQKAYCQQHNLSWKNFKRWRYKLVDEFPANKHRSSKTSACLKPTNRFVSVAIQPELTKRESHQAGKVEKIKLYFSQQCYFEIPSNLSKENLSNLLQVIKRVAC